MSGETGRRWRAEKRVGRHVKLAQVERVVNAKQTHVGTCVRSFKAKAKGTCLPSTVEKGYFRCLIAINRIPHSR